VLDPSDIIAIADAVAQRYGPYAILGFLAAIIGGIIIALKITVPFGGEFVEKRMMDPEGAVQIARRKELADFRALVTEELDAADAHFTVALAEVRGKFADIDTDKLQLETELNAIRLEFRSFGSVQENIEAHRLSIAGDLEAIKTEFKAVRADLKKFQDDAAPLLATLSGQDDEGKPVVVNQIVAALSAVQQAADAALSACYIDMKTESGAMESVPIGPNLKVILKEAILEYEASREAGAMSILAADARTRADAANAAKIAEYAGMARDPDVRAQWAAGSEIADLEEIARDFFTGKPDPNGIRKGGSMTEQNYSRAVNFLKKRGLTDALLDGGGSRGGGSYRPASGGANF
jgi:hypothetical protein